jgi:hypothetical protein
MRGWHIARSVSIGALPMEQLVNATRGNSVANIESLPPVKCVALGLPREDPALALLAEAHNVTTSPHAGSEGYALHIGGGVVLILGNSAAGVFYGAQSVLQLLGNSTVVPEVRVDDWPDFPIRGAYMFGGPSLSASYLYRSGGLAWNMQLVDWMVLHKMNFGVVVIPWVGAGVNKPQCTAKNCSKTHGIAGHFAIFYNAVPGFNANTTEATWILSQLRELQSYMEARHIEFVPNLGSGTGGGPEYYNSAFVEGKWVRNASFVFDEAEVAVVDDLVNTSQQLNGDFAELGIDQKLPARWTFEPVSAAEGQWSMSTSAPPPLSDSGRSLRCDVPTVATGSKSQTARSPWIAVNGGSIVQVTIWTKYTRPAAAVHSQGLAQTQFVAAVTTDIAGRVLKNLSYYSWFRDDTVFDWTLGPSWSQYTAAITLPLNATNLSLHFYMCHPTGRNCETAYDARQLPTRKELAIELVSARGLAGSWDIGDISVVKLDTSLRNVIRTNATDIEVWAADGTAKYVPGRDFTVENPSGTCNEFHLLNVSRLKPYIVRREPGGRIAAGAHILLSYDYLPGKVDVQGHSTPNAFMEPTYYAFMDSAIAHVARVFPHLKHIHFNHDEIRGFGRDSRSQRSGLSNSELLAKEMNALQTSVTKYLGDGGRALMWDDMINPTTENGGNVNYQWSTGGGVRGKTDLAVIEKLVDSKVIWASWAYDVDDLSLSKIKGAPQLFKSHGYNWVGCAEIPTANVLAWGKALQAAKRAGRNALGLLDVQWSTVTENSSVTDWANVPDVGACTWNLEAFLANRTTGDYTN